MHNQLSSLINKRVLHSILQVINTILENSLTDREQIAKLLPTLQPIMIRCHDLKFAFVVKISEQKLLVSSCEYTQHHQPNATTQFFVIEGSSSAIAKLLFAKNKQQALQTIQDITLHGNITNMNAWQQVFRLVDVHWERELTKRLGAMPASLLMTALQTIAHQATEYTQRLSEYTNMAVAGLTVSQHFWQNHTQDIALFHTQLQALTKRIDRIEILVFRNNT